MYIMVSSVQLDGKMTQSVLRYYFKLHDIHAVKCTMMILCEMKDDTDKNNR